MKRVFILLTALLLASFFALTVASAPLPLHSADAPIIEKLAKHNGLDAAPEVNPTKGWPALKGELSVRFAATDGKTVLLVGHDAQGRVTFDRQKNYPLSNLYVRMLRQMGIAADSFGSSNGALSELG